MDFQTARDLTIPDCLSISEGETFQSPHFIQLHPLYSHLLIFCYYNNTLLSTKKSGIVTESSSFIPRDKILSFSIPLFCSTLRHKNFLIISIFYFFYWPDHRWNRKSFTKLSHNFNSNHLYCHEVLNLWLQIIIIIIIIIKHNQAPYTQLLCCRHIPMQHPNSISVCHRFHRIFLH